jgi:hypothetical protein
MPMVMLRRDASATFRRWLRDEQGNPIRPLEFEPGKPVDVSWDDVPVIENDLHVALMPVSVGPTGKATVIDKEAFALILETDALEAATAPEWTEDIVPIVKDVEVGTIQINQPGATVTFGTAEQLAPVIPTNAAGATDGPNTRRRSR